MLDPTEQMKRTLLQPVPDSTPWSQGDGSLASLGDGTRRRAGDRGCYSRSPAHKDFFF